MVPSIFESIKHTNEHGQEYWSARELCKILEYSEYRHFLPAIDKAKIACKQSRQEVQDHFEDVLDMVSIGSDAKREVSDYRLSRYACYLIIQNSDPSKKIVAEGQTYFAIQTRKQEVSEQLLEDQKRVYLRSEMTEHNKQLAKTAKEAGVWNYGDFVDFGYMWLYGGLRNKDIHAKKKLKPSQKILDHMGSEELAANLFRATQAEAKIKREGIQGQVKASKAHFEVGKKIRSTIADIGGTMPEKLPTPESLSQAEKRLKNEEKKRIG